MNIITPHLDAPSFSVDQATRIQSAFSQGQVIVYPTDTLYGLGADATSKAAVNSLYLLKSRENSPISVLLSSISELFAVTTDLSERAIDLIEMFMPGALTVICRSDYGFAPQLKSQAGTIGFRVPGDHISPQLPALCGKPITTTSVNPAGMPPATSRSEVESYYGNQIALMVDIGPAAPSKGSTVIDLTTSPFKILREGEISRQALQEFLN